MARGEGPRDREEGDESTPLGALVASLALRGALPGGGEPWLAVTSRGLFVCGMDDGRPVEPSMPLEGDWVYEARTLGDRIRVGGDVFAIPTGRAAQARELIARGRLASTREEAVEPEGPTEPFATARGTVADAWLARWLEEGERVLAWLPVATSREVGSAVGEVATVDGAWVLTSRRHALVWLAPWGDQAVQSLPGEPLAIEEKTPRDSIACGPHRFAPALTNQAAFRELADVPALSEGARWRAIALAQHRRGLDVAARAALTGHDDPWAKLILSGLDVGDDEALPDADLVAAVAATGDGDELAAWLSLWGPPLTWAMRWVTALREAGAGGVALELHRGCRAQARAEKGAPSVGPVDVGFVEHLVEVERNEEADGLITELLEALPPVELFDLLPVTAGDEVDKTALRRRLLELRLASRQAAGGATGEVLVELARLAPLDRGRLSTVAEAAGDTLRRRVEEVRALLGPGGLAGEPVDPPEVGEWPAEAHETLIRHPAARDEGPLARLQSLLAAADVPDHSALRSYCERLAPDSSAAEVLADVCLALGVGGVQAFVSRGDKPVGVRAYESSPSFLLVGADHLDPGNDVFLRPAGLRFVVGGEIAHLRFGHARVTSSDVWSGAFEKSKATLDLLLGVAPFLKSWRFGGVLSALADRVEMSTIDRVLASAGRLIGHTPTVDEVGSLAKNTEDLIVAHRVMQLTADRAGLALAGDIRASVRAMLLVRPVYTAELPLVARRGLADVLARRDEDGQLRLADLAVRIGALVAFYLGDEHAALVAALHG